MALDTALIGSLLTNTKYLPASFQISPEVDTCLVLTSRWWRRFAHHVHIQPSVSF
jgi:hypothetical protein